jgi:hypothetical protein
MGKTSSINPHNLGELIHKSNYCFVIDVLNDKNGHLGDNEYGNYIRRITDENFLPQYGLSDDWFNEKGYQHIRRETSIRFGKGIKKGEEANLFLEVFLKNKTFFYMVFDFIRPDRERAAKIYTLDCFKEKKKEVLCEVPEFFINKIRNV